MGKRIAGLGAALLDRLLPPHCLACGEAVAGAPLCVACAAELPRNRCACPLCALPLPQPALACGRCLKRPPPQHSTCAPLLYIDPVDRWLSGLKFAGDLAVGRGLSELFDAALEHDPAADGAVVVPMPLHLERLRERGYNQALELLRPLARRRGWCLQADGLQRARATRAQSGLDARARRRNLRGAFTADPGLRGAKVLLFDDVITTGSTVAEAARTLLRAGVAEVRVLAVARVPKHRDSRSSIRDS